MFNLLIYSDKSIFIEAFIDRIKRKIKQIRSKAKKRRTPNIKNNNNCTFFNCATCTFWY